MRSCLVKLQRSLGEVTVHFRWGPRIVFKKEPGVLARRKERGSKDICSHRQADHGRGRNKNEPEKDLLYIIRVCPVIFFGVTIHL